MPKKTAIIFTIISMVSMLFLNLNSLTVKAESKIESDVNSYNPTEPEKQLGLIKTIDIDESGTVYLNKHSIQGSIGKDGDVYIETVKRPKVFAFDDEKNLKTYYFVDKDGDIFSMILNQHKYLEDKNGTQVKLKLVKFIEGRNGVADKDGFKSNLVPEKFLPKTSKDELFYEKNTLERNTKSDIINFIFAFVLILKMISEIMYFRALNKSEEKEGEKL